MTAGITMPYPTAVFVGVLVTLVFPEAVTSQACNPNAISMCLETSFRDFRTKADFRPPALLAADDVDLACRSYTQYQECVVPQLSTCTVVETLPHRIVMGSLQYLCSNTGRLAYESHVDCWMKPQLKNRTEANCLALLTREDKTYCTRSNDYNLCVVETIETICSKAAADVINIMLYQSLQPFYEFQGCSFPDSLIPASTTDAPTTVDATAGGQTSSNGTASVGSMTSLDNQSLLTSTARNDVTDDWSKTTADVTKASSQESSSSPQMSSTQKQDVSGDVTTAAVKDSSSSPTETLSSDRTTPSRDATQNPAMTTSKDQQGQGEGTGGQGMVSDVWMGPDDRATTASANPISEGASVTPAVHITSLSDIITMGVSLVSGWTTESQPPLTGTDNVLSHTTAPLEGIPTGVSQNNGASTSGGVEDATGTTTVKTASDSANSHSTASQLGEQTSTISEDDRTPVGISGFSFSGVTVPETTSVTGSGSGTGSGTSSGGSGTHATSAVSTGDGSSTSAPGFSQETPTDKADVDNGDMTTTDAPSNLDTSTKTAQDSKNSSGEGKPCPETPAGSIDSSPSPGTTAEPKKVQETSTKTDTTTEKRQETSTEKSQGLDVSTEVTGITYLTTEVHSSASTTGYDGENAGDTSVSTGTSNESLPPVTSSETTTGRATFTDGTTKFETLSTTSLIPGTSTEAVTKRETQSEATAGHETNEITTNPETSTETSVNIETSSKASVIPETSSETTSGHETSSETTTGLETTIETTTRHETFSETTTGHETSSETTTGHETSSEASVTPETSSETTTGHETSSKTTTGHNTSSETAINPETSTEATWIPGSSSETTVVHETSTEATINPETSNQASSLPEATSTVSLETASETTLNPETSREASPEAITSSDTSLRPETTTETSTDSVTSSSTSVEKLSTVSKESSSAGPSSDATTGPDTPTGETPEPSTSNEAITTTLSVSAESSSLASSETPNASTLPDASSSTGESVEVSGHSTTSTEGFTDSSSTSGDGSTEIVFSSVSLEAVSTEATSTERTSTTAGNETPSSSETTTKTATSDFVVTSTEAAAAFNNTAIDSSSGDGGSSEATTLGTDSGQTATTVTEGTTTGPTRPTLLPSAAFAKCWADNSFITRALQCMRQPLYLDLCRAVQEQTSCFVSAVEAHCHPASYGPMTEFISSFQAGSLRVLGEQACDVTFSLGASTATPSTTTPTTAITTTIGATTMTTTPSTTTTASATTTTTASATTTTTASSSTITTTPTTLTTLTTRTTPRTTASTTTRAAPAKGPIRCYDCHSGFGAYENRFCPTSGKLVEWGITVTLCKGLCFSRTDQFNQGEVFRGCYDLQTPWLPIRHPPRNGVQRIRGEQWFFCDTDNCNDNNMSRFVSSP